MINYSILNLFDFDCQNYNYSNHRWELANRQLYELCEKYPFHNNPDEIVAKMWLIGRSYAAAIERRKNAAETPGDFYYDYVADALMHSNIDENIKTLKQYGDINEDSINMIIQTHKELTDIFNKLTGLDKRSLASKYLHFHIPNMFYIYDSRAMRAIGKYIKKRNGSIILPTYLNYDDEYMDFFQKAYALQTYALSTYNSKFCKSSFPRILDTMLLESFDKK